jgi:FtsP/CotA-like multicopper oxidase with cupredoxin domain
VPLRRGATNGIYATPQTLAQPPTLTSGSTGKLALTLTVQAYRLDATMFQMNARAYCYNNVCAPLGPTLVVKPGDTLTITLVNVLETEAGLYTCMCGTQELKVKCNGPIA